jgi:hypothetical protein
VIAIVIICIVAIVSIPVAAALLVRRRRALKRVSDWRVVLGTDRPPSWAQMRGRIDRRAPVAFSTEKNLGKHPNKASISVGNLAKSPPETVRRDDTATDTTNMLLMQSALYSDGVPTHVHDAPAAAHCAPAEAPACDTSSSYSSCSSYDSGGGGFDSGGSCGGGDF